LGDQLAGKIGVFIRDDALRSPETCCGTMPERAIAMTLLMREARTGPFETL
jgi:hypothetical protein